ncbi:MAG: hypothetical protein KDC46_14585 [Thermoleophilia bacterium]|nr:hypothetical protein [Thermoleophilia bacterium]
MKKLMTMCAVTGALCSVLAATTAFATAVESTTSESETAWRSAGTAAPAEISEQLRLAATQLGDEVTNLGSGQTTSLGAQRSVNIVEAGRNTVCFEALEAGVPVIGGCTESLAQDGEFVFNTMREGRPVLVGIVMPDVSAVSVSTNDGKSSDVPVTENVIWWTGAEGTSIDSMAVTQGGKQTVSTDRFASAK